MQDHDLEPVAHRTHRDNAPSVGSPADALVQLHTQVGNQQVAQLLGAQRAEDNEQLDGSSVATVLSGGGQHLDPATRHDMQRSLGHDFGDVRIHTGTDAAASARALQANAYTVGRDIVFGDGQFSPATPDGRKTLAHELTHVVQQRSGPVDGTPAAGGVSVSDPSDRFERQAEATAARVAGGETEVLGTPAPTSAPLQREEMADDELREDDA